jgi:hypothetical protein
MKKVEKSYLLQRDESGRIRGSDSGTSVTDGSVWGKNEKNYWVVWASRELK